MVEHDKYEEAYVAWLETTAISDNDQFKKNLSNMHRNFQVYQDPNACVDFISSLFIKPKTVFLILIGTEYEYLVEMVVNLSQIAYIYLYYQNNEQILSFENKFIRFSTNNMKKLFHIIEQDIEIQEGIPPALSIFSFEVETFERSVRDLCSDHQSATFVWYQLLVDVIRQLPHTNKAKEEMIDFLKEYFHDCNTQRAQFDSFIQEYVSADAIKWYTKPGFLFQVVNRALRTQNIDNIYKLRYYLQDLYNQMENEYVEQRGLLETVKVYRGQFIRQDDLDALLKSSVHKGLIAFNSCLSTTYEENTALSFVDSLTNTDSKKIPILFTMILNLDQNRLPLVNVAHLSDIQDEDETLVAMGSIFRIDNIVEDKQQKLWRVDLIFNEEISQQLSSMINYLKNDMGNKSSLLFVGRLLGDMGDFYRSERYFRLFLNDLPSDHPDLGSVLMNLGVITHKQEQYKNAIRFFQQALHLLPEDHGDRPGAYINLGASYQAMKSYDEALEVYKDALKFNLLISDEAKIYNNMGLIYEHKQQFFESIDYYKKSLNLVTSEDPEFIATNINLALVYADKGEYENSLTYFQSSLEASKILSIDDIRIGRVHFNFGYIKAKMNEHVAAIQHFDDALAAYCRMTLSVIVKQEISKTLYEQGRSYIELDNYVSARSCFDKILSLVSNEEHLQDQKAVAIHGIGCVYDIEGEFGLALESYRMALEIWMSLLNTNSNTDRCVIAGVFNDIAEIYDKRKKYAFALWYYAGAIQFARENNDLMLQYKESFRFVAKISLYMIKKILNVHII